MSKDNAYEDGGDNSQDTEADEGPCEQCREIFGSADYMLQCEKCLGWLCLDCGGYSDSEYLFMANNDQVKWECQQCNQKTNVKGDVTNDTLLNFMKKMNENIGSIQTQLNQKTDITVTNKLDKKVTDLNAEVTDLSRRFRDIETNQKNPTPPQTQLPAEVQKKVVAQAAYHYEVENHNERQNKVIIFNMPESGSDLKVACRQHDSQTVIDLCNQCDDFDPDEIIEVSRLGPKKLGSRRPTNVTLLDVSTKSRLMRNLHRLRDAEEPFKSIRVNHDFTRSEREKEKELRAEAKTKTEQAKIDKENFIYVVRGLPGERRVVTVTPWGRPRNQEGNGENQQEVLGADGGPPAVDPPAVDPPAADPPAE